MNTEYKHREVLNVAPLQDWFAINERDGKRTAVRVPALVVVKGTHGGANVDLFNAATGRTGGFGEEGSVFIGLVHMFELAQVLNGGDAFIDLTTLAQAQV